MDGIWLPKQIFYPYLKEANRKKRRTEEENQGRSKTKHEEM